MQLRPTGGRPGRRSGPQTQVREDLLDDDLVQHRLQRIVGWRGYFYENRRAVGAAPVRAVQHQAVQVDVEIGR